MFWLLVLLGLRADGRLGERERERERERETERETEREKMRERKREREVIIGTGKKDRGG